MYVLNAESFGTQGDQTSQSLRKATLNIHWKDWCWSFNILVTWYEELTQRERPWCWERGGWQRMRWLHGITDTMDMSLNKFLEMVKDRGAWQATTVYGVTKRSDMSDPLNKNNVWLDLLMRDRFLDTVTQHGHVLCCCRCCLPGLSVCYLFALQGVRIISSRGKTHFLITTPWIGGEGNGNPLQYSCLGNPLDRGAW